MQQWHQIQRIIWKYEENFIFKNAKKIQSTKMDKNVKIEAITKKCAKNAGEKSCASPPHPSFLLKKDNVQNCQSKHKKNRIKSKHFGLVSNYFRQKRAAVQTFLRQSAHKFIRKCKHLGWGDDALK